MPCFTLTGGTSIATPMWAGISRLIAQAQGVTRLGNIDSRLYELGNLKSFRSGLVDVTAGNNTDAGIPGYSAGPGYDLVTGWGSPDIAKLVAAFPGAAAAISPVDTIIDAGATAAAGTFSITNTTSGPLTLRSVKINLSAPTIFSALILTTTVGGNPPQVSAAAPSSTSVFSLSPPVSIPSAGTATLVLQGVTKAQGPLAAGWTSATGGGASRSGGRGPCLWVGSLTLVLVWAALLFAPRWRATYAVTGLLLTGLVIVASNCSSGGGRAFTPAPSPRPTATPTQTVTATPTPQPTATPTPRPNASSNQTIPQGGISVSDGQGGLIQVTGLPGKLGSVTVEY